VRLGELHGSERLEAACGRALAINNPTYKTVKAILKNGLDKMAVVEEEEPRRVVHENIRGGDYFDREEASVASGQDEIEARYLEDERRAIRNDAGVEGSPVTPTSNRGERQPEVSNQAILRAADLTPIGATRELLRALVERLQAEESGPLPSRQARLRRYEERGGDTSRRKESSDAPCVSQDECLGETETNHGEVESKGGECMGDEVTCVSEGDQVVSPTSRRAGVG
jgi:hypothetical protein